jgi:hypothetical protein
VRSGVIAKIVAWLETELSFIVLETSLHAAAAQVPISAGQQLRELATLKNFIASAAPTLMDVPWSVLFLFVIYMINPLLGLLALCGMGMFIVVAVLNEYATRKALLRASEKSTESLLSADMIGRQAESIQAMGMMPGVRKAKEAMANIDDRVLKRQEAIILSMTKAERRKPAMLPDHHDMALGLGPVALAQDEGGDRGCIARPPHGEGGQRRIEGAFVFDHGRHAPVGLGVEGEARMFVDEAEAGAFENGVGGGKCHAFAAAARPQETRLANQHEA